MKDGRTRTVTGMSLGRGSGVCVFFTWRPRPNHLRRLLRCIDEGPLLTHNAEGPCLFGVRHGVVWASSSSSSSSSSWQPYLDMGSYHMITHPPRVPTRAHNTHTTLFANGPVHCGRFKGLGGGGDVTHLPNLKEATNTSNAIRRMGILSQHS